MRIIGIDPGSIVCGYGVIDVRGTRFSVVEFGVVEAGRKSALLAERLELIYDRLCAVLKRTTPDVAALEAVFYARNAQSLVKLSHARGVAMLALVQQRLPIAEYAARLIKQSITGRGNASKEQVSYMVRSMLSIAETPEFFDATDALAVALTHALRAGTPSSRRPRSSWRQFIEEHPERIARR